MVDIYSLEGTYTLLEAVRKIQQPVSFLADTFFPQKVQIQTDFVTFETLKAGRQVAPFVVPGTRGRNVARTKSITKYYRPPMFGPRRVISAGDLQQRQFGEIPNLYGAPTPEERFARLQAQDLSDLMMLHANRRNQMASEILQTGAVKMRAYADDGAVVQEETIDFDWSGAKTVTTSWTNASADIYNDLYIHSEKIQEECGEIPTVAICGKNVERYLLNNAEIKTWLSLPNRENLNMVSFAPHYTSPQSRFIGYISSLNLELISYSQSYIAEDGTVKNFVEPDNIIIGIAGRGKEVHGPISIFQNGGWNTISAEYVPFYTYNDDAQTTALTVYSKYILIPDDLAGWYCLKVKK